MSRQYIRILQLLVCTATYGLAQDPPLGGGIVLPLISLTRLFLWWSMANCSTEHWASRTWRRRKQEEILRTVSWLWPLSNYLNMAIGNFQIHTASISHVKRNYSVQISSDVATTRQHTEHVAPLSLPPPEVVTWLGLWRYHGHSWSDRYLMYMYI